MRHTFSIFLSNTVRFIEAIEIWQAYQNHCRIICQLTNTDAPNTVALGDRDFLEKGVASDIETVFWCLFPMVLWHRCNWTSIKQNHAQPALGHHTQLNSTSPIEINYFNWITMTTHSVSIVMNTITYANTRHNYSTSRKNMLQQFVSEGQLLNVPVWTWNYLRHLRNT